MSGTICVFCGAKMGDAEHWRALAFDTGRQIARAGLRLLYGGGSVGLMGAVAEGALGAGGEVIGIIPRHLLGQEGGKFKISRLDIVDTLAQRKTQMIEHSDAFLVLPGGLGTLDELFEVLTMRQIGLHDKVVALVNERAYFDSLARLLDDQVNAGFVRRTDIDSLIWCDSAAAAVASLAQAIADRSR